MKALWGGHTAALLFMIGMRVEGTGKNGYAFPDRPVDDEVFFHKIMTKAWRICESVPYMHAIEPVMQNIAPEMGP